MTGSPRSHTAASRMAVLGDSCQFTSWIGLPAPTEALPYEGLCHRGVATGASRDCDRSREKRRGVPGAFGQRLGLGVSREPYSLAASSALQQLHHQTGTFLIPAANMASSRYKETLEVLLCPSSSTQKSSFYNTLKHTLNRKPPALSS